MAMEKVSCISGKGFPATFRARDISIVIACGPEGTGPTEIFVTGNPIGFRVSESHQTILNRIVRAEE